MFMWERTVARKHTHTHLVTSLGEWVSEWVNHNIAGAKQCNQSLLFILSECTVCVCGAQSFHFLSPCLCVCVTTFNWLIYYYLFLSFWSSKNYIVVRTHASAHWKQHSFFPFCFVLEFALPILLCGRLLWTCVFLFMFQFLFVDYACIRETPAYTHTHIDLFIMWSGI